VPQDFHRERKAVSEKLLEATEQAVPIIQALTADDATADLNQEAVEQLMAVFQDRVTQAMAQEAAARASTKAKGQPQAPEQRPETTAEPEFYRISDLFGADTFVGSPCPELADYREAILLESFRANSELHDPFLGDSSDDGPLEVTTSRNWMMPSSGKPPRTHRKSQTKLLSELVNRLLPTRHAIQCRIGTDRQSKTAMRKIVLKQTPGNAGVYPHGTWRGTGEGTGDRPSPVAMVVLAPVPDYERLVNGCLCSATSVRFNKQANEWPNIVVLTGDPEHALWTPPLDALLRGFVDIEKAVDGHKPTIVLPFCTSNRRRSVAMGTLISAGLYVLGMDHFLGHLHANESWAGMKCGGKCARLGSRPWTGETAQSAQERLQGEILELLATPRFRRGKMGERSHQVVELVPLEALQAIGETLNVVPGIDDDPDDATPWAANLSFPDLMDLARDLNDAGHEDKKRDGWKGPMGLGAGNTRTLLHNARF
ncbi:unnamed protein product, partial [Symbiodinium necroappetens]